MQRRTFTTILGGVVAWPTLAAAQAVTKVTVLDAEFRPIRTIMPGPELAAFSERWATRAPDADAVMRPDYKIDVQSGGRSERWLYDPAGFVRVLSKKKVPVYRLKSPAAFNALLGIAR